MRLKVDHASAVPLHAQVEDLLRGLIGKPEYQEGKLLPPEKELAKMLGISRHTVRQAAQRLVHEGLLRRKKGVGTRVETRRVATNLCAWGSFTHEMERKGTRFETLSREAGRVSADGEICAFFDIAEDTPVVRLKRIKGRDGDPVVLFESYFHPRVGIGEDADFSKPLYELLEEDFATVAVYSNEEISAEPADAALADVLDVEPGSPVLVRKRRVSDPGRRPIEYNRCYYRADRFVYTIEIQRASYR